MYMITNYRHLEQGKTYRFFNSLGESSVHVYGGYHYDDEVHDDILILRPVGNELGTEMDCQEFSGALDDTIAQNIYQKMCETVAARINVEDESLEVALLYYENSGDYSFIQTLHQAGKTFKDFREAVAPRVEWHRPKPAF
ncbi:hypothetical protein ABES02_29920 [Neobacillus pocheonensis]|uniref:hypothetical protein n=1 Tax=Neobacillus pocheonensis TaxID=363869 RepID=UPI003D2B6206